MNLTSFNIETIVKYTLMGEENLMIELGKKTHDLNVLVRSGKDDLSTFSKIRELNEQINEISKIISCLKSERH